MKNERLFLAIASLFVCALIISGCGDGKKTTGGGGIAPVLAAPNGANTSASDVVRIVTQTLHQGAYKQIYPLNVDANMGSPKVYEVYGPARSPFYEFSCARYSGTTPYCYNDADAVSQEWSATHGFLLSAIETQPIRDGYNLGRFGAMERTGTNYNSFASGETNFDLFVNVIADIYALITSIPSNGGTLACHEGAIEINDTIGNYWDHWSLLRQEATNTVSMPALIAVSNGKTIVTPAPSTGYMKTGHYSFEMGYGYAWSTTTGDYKPRTFRIEFDVVAGNNAQYCTAFGARVSARYPDANFQEMPAERWATDEAKKKCLAEEGVKRFFEPGSENISRCQ